MGDQLAPQLVMRRVYLHGLPPMEVPAGYAIRCFREGDQKAWETIIQETFETTSYVFDTSMKGDPAYQAERVLFVVRADTDEPVATASAWLMERIAKVVGYLHMVGVRPGHQGKQLGYWVSLAAMYRFVEEGRMEAILQTDDFRVPAVKTYLKMGFEPVLVHENQRGRWRTFLAGIGREDLSVKFRDILDGPVVRIEGT